MPAGDDWDAPDHWSAEEADIYREMIDDYPDLLDDPVIETLVHAAYFDMESGFSARELDSIREELSTYLEDNFGLDWDDIFDWEAYREWYG